MPTAVVVELLQGDSSIRLKKVLSSLSSLIGHCAALPKGIKPHWVASVRGISLRKVTLLDSNLASVTDLKELKLHTVYAAILEAIKP